MKSIYSENRALTPEANQALSPVCREMEQKFKEIIAAHGFNPDEVASWLHLIIASTLAEHNVLTGIEHRKAIRQARAATTA